MNLENRPDAIIAFSDQVAISAILYLKEHCINIPGEVAVVGFNNEPGNDLMSPSLSSIKQPVYEMGQKAAQLMLRQIDGESINTVEILQSSLVKRKSSSKL